MKDKFEVDLEDKLKELKECQDSMNIKSCFNCDEYFECIIRIDYKKSVYNSMSKGNNGGFSF